MNDPLDPSVDPGKDGIVVYSENALMFDANTTFFTRNWKRKNRKKSIESTQLFLMFQLCCLGLFLLSHPPIDHLGFLSLTKRFRLFVFRDIPEKPVVQKTRVSFGGQHWREGINRQVLLLTESKDNTRGQPHQNML